MQVEGVDEADSVKYDGRYIYRGAARDRACVFRHAAVLSRNVLDIARTDPLTAGVEPVSKFVIEGEQSAAPLLYQLAESARRGGLSGRRESELSRLAAAAGAADRASWSSRTRRRIQLLDVRDPTERFASLEARARWLDESQPHDRTTRCISSAAIARDSGPVLPADTLEKREANERRIRSSAASELLPSYSENGGPRRQLVRPDGCLVAQQIGRARKLHPTSSSSSAINVRTRRVTDVNCLSTNVNAVYVSRERACTSRASGFVRRERADHGASQVRARRGRDHVSRHGRRGRADLAGATRSYFMDEHEGDLRILTTANGAHRLTVLRESAGRSLMLVSALPNATRPRRSASQARRCTPCDSWRSARTS